MKVSVKAVDMKDGKIILRETELDRVLVGYRCVMSIDGSTTSTGITIHREQDGALVYTACFTRDAEETPVQYKVRLKRAVYSILERNRNIETVFYEEPFIGYATAAANLLMLRTFVEELTVEHEDVLGYLKFHEINNKRWKKLFLAPDKCPSNSELEKEMVKKKLVRYLPFMKDVTQDEIDATAMGWVACTQIRKGLEEELRSKKKARAFKYNIKFIGAEDDEFMINELLNVYDGPKSLLENGVVLKEVPPRAGFDKAVYEEMGEDDKVLIMKFSSDKHGNIILQHRIGHLAATYPYLYGVVWRKYRK